MLAYYIEPMTYGFPLGRVRVREGRLLPLQRLERLVDAADFVEQRRILAETDYDELFAHVETAEAVEDALDLALEGAYDFMEESRLPEPVIEFFRVRYDFLNLRMLLKHRIAGAPKPERWSSHGSVLPAVFEAAAKTAGADWLDGFPARLATTAQDVVESATGGEHRSAEAAAIDVALDRALYLRIHDVTRAEGSGWFVGVGRVMIDMANARIALRARRFGKDREWLETALIPDGGVSTNRIAAAQAPIDEIADEVHAALLGEPAEQLAQLLEDLADPATTDIAADNVVLRMARRGRLVATGVEPIASYMLAVENEIALLRIVLLGKLANLPNEAIHERVRELYA